MADQLPASIPCGGSAAGFGEVISKTSKVYHWASEIGYGKAREHAVDELDQDHATADADKGKLLKKVNDWLKSVDCAPTAECKQCRKSVPFNVMLDDIAVDDTTHIVSGSALKSGSLEVTRAYSVSSGKVRCLCEKVSVE